MLQDEDEDEEPMVRSPFNKSIKLSTTITLLLEQAIREGLGMYRPVIHSPMVILQHTYYYEGSRIKRKLDYSYLAINRKVCDRIIIIIGH